MYTQSLVWYEATGQTKWLKKSLPGVDKSISKSAQYILPKNSFGNKLKNSSSNSSLNHCPIFPHAQNWLKLEPFLCRSIALPILEVERIPRDFFSSLQCGFYLGAVFPLPYVLQCAMTQGPPLLRSCSAADAIEACGWRNGRCRSGAAWVASNTGCLFCSSSGAWYSAWTFSSWLLRWREE